MDSRCPSRTSPSRPVHDRCTTEDNTGLRNQLLPIQACLISALPFARPSSRLFGLYEFFFWLLSSIHVVLHSPAGGGTGFLPGPVLRALVRNHYDRTSCLLLPADQTEYHTLARSIPGLGSSGLDDQRLNDFLRHPGPPHSGICFFCLSEALTVCSREPGASAYLHQKVGGERHRYHPDSEFGMAMA